MIKVLIADDHIVVRQGIRQLLQDEPNFTVTGEAANGLEVLHLLDTGVKADVVLADMNMSEMNGLELVQAIRNNFPGLAIVLLTMQEETWMS